jgi:hypothetical protein
VSSLLQNSPAEVTAAWLIQVGDAGDPTSWSSGTGNTLWPVFTQGEPFTPDQLIVCKDTVGQDDGEEMVTLDLLYHYGIQIMVRAQDHLTGYIKACQIREDMAKKGGGITVAPLGSSHTYQIWCFAHIGPVLPLGKQVPTTKRSLFTINAMLPILQLT